MYSPMDTQYSERAPLPETHSNIILNPLRWPKTGVCLFLTNESFPPRKLEASNSTGSACMRNLKRQFHKYFIFCQGYEISSEVSLIYDIITVFCSSCDTRHLQIWFKLRLWKRLLFMPIFMKAAGIQAKFSMV